MGARLHQAEAGPVVRLNRSRASLALRLAESADTASSRQVYLSLWREWSTLADQAEVRARYSQPGWPGVRFRAA